MFTNLLLALGISFIIQILFFIFAARFKTDKFTDLSYGLTFVLIAIYFFVTNDITTASTIAMLMVVLWGLRLATYLFIRILKTKTDKRFDGIRENFGSFAKFWLLQGFSIWLIILPVVVIINKPLGELTTTNYIGIGIWLFGLTIETVADYQKFIFKNNPANKGKFIQSGLWASSRHPNYLGELLVWWGIFLFASNILVGWELLTIIGPIFITTLILFVTGIPTLEKAYDKRYANNKEYQKYKKNTGVLLPIVIE